MAYFLPEVNKISGELFPGKTLYQLVVSIQKHLNINCILWKIIDNSEFIDIHTALDNVMKEHTELGLGTDTKQADLITPTIEEDLWSRHFLGSDTPLKLQRTVYFGLGMNCILRSVQEHHSLCRWVPDRASQLTFKRNSKGVRCLIYREDHVTKTHDGG